MAGAPIKAVNQLLATFKTALNSNPALTEVAWVSIITFNEKATQLFPLTAIEVLKIPTLTADSCDSSNYGEALSMLWDCMKREVIFTETEIHREDYRPLIFFLTDAEPSDDGKWEPVAAKLKSAGVDERMHCFIAGCNNSAASKLKIISDHVYLMADTSPTTVSELFREDTCEITTEWQDKMKASFLGNEDDCGTNYTSVQTLPPLPAGINILSNDDIWRGPRIPVYIIIDTSGSMAGAPIKEVNQALAICNTALKKTWPFWVSIITFNETATQLFPLTDVRKLKIPTLTADSCESSNYGEAFFMLWECMKKEVIFIETEMQPQDIRPLVFFFTAGEPTDDGQWEPVEAMLEQKNVTKGMHYFIVGTKEAIPKLKAMRYTEIFTERFFSRLFFDYEMATENCEWPDYMKAGADPSCKLPPLPPGIKIVD